MAAFLRILFTHGLMWAALGLHVVICACYLRRWDKMAAITVFPFWAWGLAGVAMAGVSWLAGRRRLAAIAFWGWLGTIIIGSDETRPLLRFTTDKPVPGEAAAIDGRRPLRIVSLNCKVGIWHPHAMYEVEAWQPDIVFLQEAPMTHELQKFAAKLYGEASGHFEGGSKCAILARGKIRNAITGFQPYSILGTVEVETGKVVEVACVHLQVAETSVQLWTKDAFRRHWHNRLSRRGEMARLLGVQRLYSGDHPAIIGGDFNAPAGDAVFDLLKDSGFRDAFAEAGSGWANTYPNVAPVLRIDHLWVNQRVAPHRAITVKTQHSDHRMLVCDVLLP
jgi:endonuclease/exonuclease/phosphatase family metal-dependent hydrolase